jgi:hypothetical protein
MSANLAEAQHAALQAAAAGEPRVRRWKGYQQALCHQATGRTIPP